MQSEQENVLETFMNHSFGSRCLYIPHKIKKGNANREPADLLWVNGSLVARFYLKSGTSKTFDQQNQGNFAQADGYRRNWISGDHNWILRGTNSDGYKCEIPYASVSHHLIVSVVSKHCGVIAQRVSEKYPSEIRITVPEELFYWISAFHGTIADLLSIIKDYLKRHPMNSEKETNDGFDNLHALTKEYESWSWASIDGNPILYLPTAHADIRKIMAMMSVLRSAPTEGPAEMLQDVNTRLSSYFGDLTFTDYIQLSAAVALLLRDARLQKTSIIKTLIKTNHHDFLISFIAPGALDADLQRAADGQLNGVHLIYGQPEFFDQRSPLLINTPKKITSPGIQAKKLHEDIATLCL